MSWLRNLLPTAEDKIFLETARKVFEEVCSSDSSAADVYRNHPKIKEQHWREIRVDFKSRIRTKTPNERTKRIRAKFAEMIQLLVTDHFYTNLATADREIYSWHALNSTREVQDNIYYFSLAYHYLYAEILQVILFHGWDGSEESKRQLKRYQTGLMEECKAHCELVMLIARAAHEGRELTDAEKERGKGTLVLKEGLRRALAGEKVLDD